MLGEVKRGKNDSFEKGFLARDSIPLISSLSTQLLPGEPDVRVREEAGEAGIRARVRWQKSRRNPLTFMLQPVCGWCETRLNQTADGERCGGRTGQNSLEEGRE